MAKTETLHVRIDPDTKRSTDEILSVLGLSTAEAVNIFLHQIVLRGGLPFQIMLPAPNDETLAAMREAREIASEKIPAKSYNSVKELMEDLMSDADDQTDE